MCSKGLVNREFILPSNSGGECVDIRELGSACLPLVQCSCSGWPQARVLRQGTIYAVRQGTIYSVRQGTIYAVRQGAIYAVRQGTECLFNVWV